MNELIEGLKNVVHLFACMDEEIIVEMRSSM
jgi:hypothetical protein